MERKILFNLVYVNEDIEEQKNAIRRLEELPLESYDNETVEFIKAVHSINESNKLVDTRTLNTYLTFNKTKIDIQDYFWDTNEKEAKEIDLSEAVKNFVKTKQVEINTKLIEDALEKYKATGDTNELSNLNISRVQDKKYVISMAEATEAGLEKLLRIKNKVDTSSVKFRNFFYLQMILKGLDPGELIIIAARPAVGKTAFGLALTNDISKQGKKVLFISLEMSREELTERMLIAKTGITRSTFYSQSNFTDEKYQELVNAKKELDRQSIRIIDEPPTSFVEIREIIRQEYRNNGIDLVVIDYLGLITSYDKDDRGLDTRTTISKISREAKLLAKELKIPMIILQQVNRNVAAGHRDDSSFKELQLTDLRDSGSLEQDANKVFLLWNKKPETEAEKQEVLDSQYKVIFSIAKNRNGQSNQKILFEFNHSLQRVKEIDWITKPSTWTSNK